MSNPSLIKSKFDENQIGAFNLSLNEMESSLIQLESSVKEMGLENSLKPLSQLAHDHFTTLCDRNILASHDLSHTLHDHSHSLHLF